MNGIILYQSKYGATKKYAQWLSEKTGFPCVETKQARLSDQLLNLLQILYQNNLILLRILIIFYL